jgi:hypothetical protein
MTRRLLLSALLALPLIVAGWVYGKSSGQALQAEPAYTCPITGEELPCPNCCPLNNGK